ncbi:MAG: purine-binding chemotaxis protein CheW [Calditrichaceae bacterium]|nr:chemotaxis protein CheW [Calditrichia bacterium]NUQ42230.1 purine-binding chemotaxis protein CheW [Calditrichaceae bacterium]
MDFQNSRSTQEVQRLSIFELAGKLFGLDILRSREVIPLPRFTPLPNSGDTFWGVFNLRGEIFPLVDVSSILGLPPKQIQSDDMVILVDSTEGFVIGMLVDKIHSILTYLPAEVKIPRGMVSKTMEFYLSGVLQHKYNLIHILELENLLRAKPILAHY